MMQTDAIVRKQTS